MYTWKGTFPKGFTFRVTWSSLSKMKLNLKLPGVKAPSTAKISSDPKVPAGSKNGLQKLWECYWLLLLMASLARLFQRCRFWKPCNALCLLHRHSGLLPHPRLCSHDRWQHRASSWTGKLLLIANIFPASWVLLCFTCCAAHILYAQMPYEEEHEIHHRLAENLT